MVIVYWTQLDVIRVVYIKGYLCVLHWPQISAFIIRTEKNTSDQRSDLTACKGSQPVCVCARVRVRECSSLLLCSRGLQCVWTRYATVTLLPGLGR